MVRVAGLFAPLPSLEEGLCDRLNALYTTPKMDDPRNVRAFLYWCCVCVILKACM